MKRFFILSLMIAMAMLSCTKSKEIEIRLSNPQGLTLHFDGYSSVNAGTQEAMAGTTPQSFNFSLEKGDQVIGQVWKSDSTNFTDTLRFQVFVDGEEHTNMTYNLLIPFSHIQYTLSVQ